MTENKNPITQLKQYKTAKNEPKEPVKAKNNINTPIKGEPMNLSSSLKLKWWQKEWFYHITGGEPTEQI